MNSALITGGAGFIGHHLVQKLLDNNVRTIVIDNLSTGHYKNVPDGADFLVGDICNVDLVTQHAENVDVIFHLAAVATVQGCHDRITECHRTNSLGVSSVIEAARNLNGKPAVVFASSAAVYGSPCSSPITERTAIAPTSLYGADKAAAEARLEIAAKLFGLRATSLRLFNVFGPNQSSLSDYAGVISLFVSSMIQGHPITIFGDGHQIRDFIHVKDVVEHFYAAGLIAAQSAPGWYDKLNVCSGKGTSINELFSILSEHIGYSLEPKRAPHRPGDISISVGDPTTAQSLLGTAQSQLLHKRIQSYVEYLKRT